MRYHRYFSVLHIRERHTAGGTTGTSLYCTLQNGTLQTVPPVLLCTAHYRTAHCRRYHRYFSVLHITAHCRRYHRYFSVLHITERHTAGGTGVVIPTVYYTSCFVCQWVWFRSLVLSLVSWVFTYFPQEYGHGCHSTCYWVPLSRVPITVVVRSPCISHKRAVLRRNILIPPSL